MRSTQDAVGVGPEALADTLTTHLLAQREESLPKAGNGQTIRVSDPYAADVRRDMRDGSSCEIKRLMAVLLCDVHDGVPIAKVESTLDLMRAELRAEAKIRSDRATLAILSLEQKTQGKGDLAQLHFAAHPECPDAAQAVLDTLAEYKAPLAELEARASMIVVAAKGPRRRVMAPRPGTHGIAIHR